ncbi:putative Short chain dehydrogenase/reductase family oxidoreductase [Taphrina deformans PYCC 5710]|uniref:Short chain dehydrogenase/reductase family oxidoreductase n=1 Tax=Taphrina deformans (strain PYCC 5710 / ATCC 11124 / CBS 356.35 / IMI 108563 / JCM 9778 / NBRC 8474) TaxID=1097556 RepID=R4XG41_TAPDE|nr:putative Short chain dehydrogenase/reductase family oxidoreductase [Taphrina deformans PYCC 5710]|eukprot:CCG83464.1 putative Short chain dehydrogenase/reductase family oxidoreductase [Taphrina deformans PYCC 5710]
MTDKKDIFGPKTMVSAAIDAKILQSEPDMDSLRGKNVLITGGAGGLGKAMAERYIAAGANVTIGDLDVTNGEKLARTNRALEFKKCNVLSWDDQKDLFEFAYNRFSGLDIVVANAGVTERGFSCTDDLEKPGLFTLNINLQAQFYTAKLAHYYLRRNPKGVNRDRVLLLTGSMASVGEIPGAPEYTASKHGMLGLMRSLRRTAPSDDIRVNSIHPWFVETGIIDEGVKLLLAGTRYANIEDVVRAVMILSTEKVNGRALAIMAPDVGVVDLFPSDDTVGDFQVFTDRVAHAFGLRNRALARVSYVKDWVKQVSHLVWRTGKLPLLAFLLTLAYRKRKSPYVQIKLMEMVQKYHELRGN